MDHLPGAYYLRQKVSGQLAQHFEGYGYQGIELPIIENVDLHLRKTGQGIRRWLYRFQDQTGAELCLRPEITASVVRALLPQLADTALPLRLHYQGPVFRQNQQPHQTTQLGVELIGLTGELAEAECIEMAFTGLQRLGLTDLELVLSHMGVVIGMVEDWIEEERYRDFVIASYSNLGQELPTVGHLAQRLDELGLLTPTEPLPETQQQLAQVLAGLGRHQSQVLLTGLLEMLQMTTDQGPTRDMAEVVERLVTKLDRATQQAGVRKFITAAQELALVKGPAQTTLPALAQFLAHHGLVPSYHRSLTDLLGYLAQTTLPAPVLDFSFGRTLHYYSGLIFEIRHRGVTLCGGGRYDGLLRSLGSLTDCPTVGFSYHLEHITDALALPPTSWQLPGFVQVVLCPATPTDYGSAVQIAHRLRAQGRTVLVQPDHSAPDRIVIQGNQAILPDGQTLPIAGLTTYLP
ncbi:ATP phosphoribosyltransferase regulatory subunit [Candidatus Cyanaurora vandensis]|uniref:ATP phosphoribosyltransferase regulatory subunit n=1 Tax=Candidatus Cyanaurora vandensis TaxID=2714958 RepID=UPI00257DBFCF|nr:ATP phosphoribosyltransferase regulatory subunit [Candidatus Cyanaurora vandensis]